MKRNNKKVPKRPIGKKQKIIKLSPTMTRNILAVIRSAEFVQALRSQS